MSLYRDAIQEYSKNGILTLINSGFVLIKHNILGYQTLSVGDVHARFYARKRSARNNTRSRFSRENNSIKDVLTEIRNTDIFYDIGANTGLYSLFVEQKIDSGGVIAFEPFPPNVRQFRKNAHLNEANIEIRQEAVSDKNGFLEFQWPDEELVGYGEASISLGGGKSHTVKGISIDGLVEKGELPPPNVIKIDVEGAEPLVIEGMKDTLRINSCRAVYCEIHHRTSGQRPSIEDFGYTVDDLDRIMNKLDFNKYIIESGRNRSFCKYEKY